MTNGFIIIFVTTSSVREGRRIASVLLAKRLVACANLLPGVESRFWWKGRIDSAREALLILKTVKAKFPLVSKEIKRIHSYEVPEIVAISIIAGSRKYLAWVDESVKFKA